MPSCPSPPPVIPPLNHHHHHNRRNSYILPLLLSGTLSLTLALLIFFTIFLYRKLCRNRTAPSDLIAKSPSDQPNHCRRFSYSQIHRATNSFAPSNHLGHGGFGSVYKAVLPNASLAVKVMDSSIGSLQGEREFHNELSLSSSLSGGGSPHIVSLLGFSSDRRGRKLILVYELMANRSLQDALLDRKCEELMDWNQRFAVAIDVAKGIEFLHHSCNPPIVHGDIKPSNILLDADFNAKIGDFGLARVKTDDCNANNNVLVEEEVRKDGAEDSGSVLDETDSVVTGYEEGSVVINVVGLSPENCAIAGIESGASPDTVSGVSPEVGLEKASVSEACFDKISIDSSKDLASNNGGCKQKGGSKRDWWWKQDTNGGFGSESGRVKDYVMEWIGREIKKERPSNEWIHSENGSSSKTDGKKEKIKKKEKNRKPREWWKEEFCEELARKKKYKKKKRGLSSISSIESWFQKHEDYSYSIQDSRIKKKKKKMNSIDLSLDGFSGDLRSIVGRRNSQDSTWCDMNIPKSGGVSSTPSMRGTVCYIAPECGGGGALSEKCDVYSFGVLLLVLISGRRPLQVTASPMSEFERANLISWARQLACNGKLLDLVDRSIHSLDKGQAVLCITIALLCLQRSPAKRPTMKEIVGMLYGVAEPPHLPFEFSPSPPMGLPFKSRKKARGV